MFSAVIKTGRLPYFYHPGHDPGPRIKLIMSKEDEAKPASRDFSTISPSAKSLLLMKGYTNIPFARETAERISYPAKYLPDLDNKDPLFLARMLHFESRYWSINQLLDHSGIKNILELSSGFSFRGLEACKQKGVHYIDTDLPSMVEMKKGFIPDLLNEGETISGTLELLPLNALDEEQFRAVVSRFPAGEIAIVNEGLLMYLNLEEKERLCKIIYQVLRERGGCWITADIYVRQSNDHSKVRIDKTTSEFLKQHKVEDNKFGSFEEAREFFGRMGFQVDKEAAVDRSKLSALRFFRAAADRVNTAAFQKAPKMHATWRLSGKPAS